ncbi:restriction endonuclease subunit S [Streptococcus suis]|uniref:restriction endonuclease subunit S n=1 Tax=Streptococcus suis TaxID=1307 RepID=UPI0038BC8A11
MTKEKSTVPRLRFPGFTDAWKQRKLGEYFVERLECSAEGELLSVTISDGVRRFSELDRKDNSSEDKTKYKVLKQGDIVYNSMRMWQGASGYSIYDGIVSPAYTVLIPTYLSYALFFSYLFKRSSSLQIFQVNSQGLTSDTWNLKYKPFSNIVFPAPTLPEQEAIGSFFSDLDQLITLHQRKLDDVKELKKALLQKMFPKGNGNDFPELRFPEFTDAWKQRKLGEVGYAKSGVGFPEKEQGGTTGIPFFKVSDMNTNGNENELVVANNYVTDEQISKRKWRVITEVPAIFFAKVGAAVMLNRKRLIRHPFLLDNNTMAYVFNHIQWETNFGKILFETIDLTQLTQVGALPSYNSSDVENINISLPTLPEQEAIGSFFSDLDQLITLHQRQLDHLKLLKKALLQQMFI